MDLRKNTYKARSSPLGRWEWFWEVWDEDTDEDIASGSANTEEAASRRADEAIKRKAAEHGR